MSDIPTLTGRHLIAGNWTASDGTFRSDPVTGEGQDYCAGGAAEIDAAATAAAEAFATYGWTSREDRAALLERIAEEIEARGPQLTAIGGAETGLPAARLEGERGRTCGQLRLFAGHLRDGAYLDIRHDPALPDRAPLPRPDLRLMQRPVGPVGVFGASNFPLAFSTAGGDTAAALAAGCPVVYKGHPGHPGTCELVAGAIDAAIRATGMPAGVFSMVQSNTNEAGGALVQHPAIRAVGFTGSFGGGKALFDLAMARPEPIPFFGELGSLNPVFVMPAALAARGAAMGEGWAQSLTMGVGQFCTNPGIVVLPEGPEGDAFLAAAAGLLNETVAQPMLTGGTAAAYAQGVETLSGAGLDRLTAAQACGPREGAPAVFQASAADWLARPDLAREVFGPAAIVIRTAAPAEMLKVAQGLHGQLTATLLMEDADIEAARPLMPVLESKAGRVLANAFPTGVEVADAMVHGGPFPASTNFGATSVGTMAIRRFLRPVCYQNLPAALLPGDLQAI
ncbi:aldehyde dehydrogenase (NADP(+)) [Mangrovicoccus algicola]|uniref:Aldehyde dehydrogenase (NADP(+)) n=1 Tax=Mangrovicoccus algicola TaxID=2771008 RepID=A0A8J6YSZ1_9RHOB|nr:aldehyde dehydrogenase (NADP(+)) [Mangrovicoccus algicola]MBE3638598.1 aldehyde dehydrogenase (NADP(+)) [Mangrovicoccus algicola]